MTKITIIIYTHTGPLTNVTLTAINSRSLTFSWYNPADSEGRHGDVLRYPITCVSEENTLSAYGRSDGREFMLEGLAPYSTYNCCVSIQTTLANSSVVCLTVQTPEEGWLAILIAG